MLTPFDRWLTTPPEPAPEVDEDELMEALLRDLWRKHAGTTDADPFLRFARALEQEADFYQWFREGWDRELRILRRQIEQTQEPDPGAAADIAYETRRDDRLTGDR